MKSFFLNLSSCGLRVGLSLFPVLTLLAALPTPAQTGTDPNPSAVSAASSKDNKIAAGTVLPVVLHTSFSFDKCKPGQILRGKIDKEIHLSHGGMIPKGADVVGHIVEVIPASKQSGAKVSMQFDKVFVAGRWFPLVTNLGAIGDNADALWALAPDARGTYGLEDLQIAHHGRTPPIGTIVLATQSQKMKLQTGDALLLLVE